MIYISDAKNRKMKFREYSKQMGKIIEYKNYIKLIDPFSLFLFFLFFISQILIQEEVQKSLNCHLCLPKFTWIKSSTSCKQIVGNNAIFANFCGKTPLPEFKLLNYFFINKFYTIFKIILPNNLPFDVAKHSVMELGWRIMPIPTKSPFSK